MLKVVSFLKVKNKKLVLKFYPWACSVKLVMQAFTVPCSSNLFFLVEMLPYLSSPMYSVLFYFIWGGVGYLPFKKMNRNFWTHKMGGWGISAPESGWLNPPHCIGLSGLGEALLPAHCLTLHTGPAVEMLEVLLLVKGTQESTKENYLALSRMAL